MRGVEFSLYLRKTYFGAAQFGKNRVHLTENRFVDGRIGRIYHILADTHNVKSVVLMEHTDIFIFCYIYRAFVRRILSAQHFK